MNFTTVTILGTYYDYSPSLKSVLRRLYNRLCGHKFKAVLLDKNGVERTINHKLLLDKLHELGWEARGINTRSYQVDHGTFDNWYVNSRSRFALVIPINYEHRGNFDKFDYPYYGDTYYIKTPNFDPVDI